MMIIVTRPSPYGEELTQLCNDVNIPAKHMPLFRIEKGGDLIHLQSLLDQLKTNDVIVCTSPQVIYAIKRHLPSVHFPKDVHYLTVGQHTAEQFGVLTHQRVLFPTENENSEGLIDYLQQLNFTIDNATVLILCGDVGRDLIANYFLQHNAHVKKVNCYKRIAIKYPHIISTSNIEKLFIVVTSVEHLLQLEKYCDERHKAFSNLIISNTRLADKAKKQGWQNIFLSANANNQNLFKTITTLCHNA